MRFQGENCTLSFGLRFEREQVLLSGIVWMRQASKANPQPLRLPFDAHLSETDLLALQRWLVSEQTDPPLLPYPIRQVRRLTNPGDDVAQLELELAFDQVPPWWYWDKSFPLTIELEVRKNEYEYLTNALGRDQWSADLSW